jgi:DNA integrity scanning protein DisA with diadenylate cyclase activity
VSKKLFVLRALFFSLFACIIPFVFIAWRYSIFSVKENPKISLTGWGFVAIIIVFFFVRYLVMVIKKSIPHSLLAQVINGFIKVLMPLILVYVVIGALESGLYLFKQALVITIISEAIAIVINPFPQYMFEKGVEDFEGLLDIALKKIRKKGE